MQAQCARAHSHFKYPQHYSVIILYTGIYSVAVVIIIIVVCVLIIFYVLLPYIIYVMELGRFSQSPAFLSRTAKERDKKYSVKSPWRYKK